MKCGLNHIAFCIALLAATGCHDSGERPWPDADISDAIDQPLKIEFSGNPGTLPTGWEQSFTGDGQCDWRLTEADGQKLLVQQQKGNPNKHFNMAILQQGNWKNPDVAVEFKAITGFHDQGGGLVWRYADEKNHYIVRANPLENNVVLYKMENGVRTDLPLVDQGRTYGINTPEMGFQWHRLHVRVTDSLFTVYYDGRQLFRVVDSTFRGPGKIGLWTKADAVTAFRKLEVSKE